MTERIVSRETLGRTRSIYQKHFKELEIYLEELFWWNKKVNLVSREVSRETIREHIVHSLIPQELELLSGVENWVDAGTGGGLPGIPLAITLREFNWILCDTVSKKIAAVKQMVHKLELRNVNASADSVEKIIFPDKCGVITKHAFKTEVLLKLINKKSWDKLIMYKGADEAEKEIRQLKSQENSTLYRFDFGNKEGFYDGKGILVVEK